MGVNQYELNGQLFHDVESDDLVGTFHDNRVHLYAVESKGFFERMQGLVGVVGVLADKEGEAENNPIHTSMPEQYQTIRIQDWIKQAPLGSTLHLAGQEWIINAIDIHITEHALQNKLNTKKVYIEYHVHHITNDNKGMPLDGIDTRYHVTPPLDKAFANHGKNEKIVELKQPINFRLNRKVMNDSFLTALFK